MNEQQKVGVVLRSLPDRRVVVRTASGEQITAFGGANPPRYGAEVFIANTGVRWVVVSWQ